MKIYLILIILTTVSFGCKSQDYSKNEIDIEIKINKNEWVIRLPGLDNKLGSTYQKLVDKKNPFGLDIEDPDGKDDIILNHENFILPKNTKIKFQLKSEDIIHTIKTKKIKGHFDIVPGMKTEFELVLDSNTKIIGEELEIGCSKWCSLECNRMLRKIELTNYEEFVQFVNNKKKK